MDIRKTKPFEELEITDDFMFGAVMSDPDNLKPLLEYKFPTFQYYTEKRLIIGFFIMKSSTEFMFCK